MTTPANIYCPKCGCVFYGTPGQTCPCCEDVKLELCSADDEADAELQARIDSDPDVAGACCPECEDSHSAIGSGKNPVISKGSAK